MAFGWRRLPGSSRNYINDATGEVLSRRQFDKIVEAMGEHRMIGGAEHDAFAGKTRAYRATLKMFRDMRAREGRPLSKREAMRSEEFKQLYRDSRARGGLKNPAARERAKAKRTAAFDYLGRGTSKTFQQYYDEAGSDDGGAAATGEVIPPMDYTEFDKRTAALNRKVKRVRKRASATVKRASREASRVKRNTHKRNKGRR